MRIAEILYWNNEPSETHRFDPQVGQSPPSFNGDATNLANAFTRRGLVKSFWNLPGSEGQPRGPVPRDAGPEVIPSGTLEPTTASWQAEPVPKERPMGPHRLVPFRQYRGRPGTGSRRDRRERKPDPVSDQLDIASGASRRNSA
jgi:hypothetical protein